MRKAFTLVELLVVIAIMGILTTIAIGQFQTAKRKANDVARKGDLNAVSKALQMYYADYKKFPTASSDGRIVIGSGTNTKTVNWGDEFVDEGYIYMKKMPKENVKGFPQYCYKSSADGKSYALFAKLENKEDKQCQLDTNKSMTYDCGGIDDNYCFVYLSPNIAVDVNGNLSSTGGVVIPTSGVVLTSTPVPTAPPTATRIPTAPPTATRIPTAPPIVSPEPTTPPSCLPAGSSCSVRGTPCCDGFCLRGFCQGAIPTGDPCYDPVSGQWQC